MLVSQRIDHLLNGVSQRPQELRQSSQAEAQVNALSHPAHGLVKRPGTQHIAQLIAGTGSYPNVGLHTIDRDVNERYYLVMYDGGIRLFDALTGTEQSIAYPAGVSTYFTRPGAEHIAVFDAPRPTYGNPAYWMYAKDYRFGPEQFRFLGDQDQPTPSNREFKGGIQSGYYINGGSYSDTPPYPSQALYTTGHVEYDMPSADQWVEAEFSWFKGIPASYFFTLRARQTSYGQDSWEGYHVSVQAVYTPGFQPKLRFYLGKSSFGGILGSEGGTVDIPLKAGSYWTRYPEWDYRFGPKPSNYPTYRLVNPWYKVKLVTQTLKDSGGTPTGVLAQVYLDDAVILAYTFATPSLMVLGAGHVGFATNGKGENDLYRGGGTCVDNFRFGSIVSSETPTDAPDLGPAHRAVTVGDQTIIVNTAKKVEISAERIAERLPEALIVIREADYSTKYSVTVDGITKTHTTADGVTPASRASITTEYIATQLHTALAADTTLGTAGFTFTRNGSTIYVTKAIQTVTFDEATGEPTNDYSGDGTNPSPDFEITATDGLSDTGILVIKGSVQRFEDLPVWAEPGMVVEITGDPGSEFDNYFVEYVEVEGVANRGYWKECAKPNEEYLLDDNTMPWVLERTADGGWTCQPGPWKERAAGSLVTNPFPSFVGQSLRDVFYVQGRLGVVALDSVILSETAKLFNFTRKSVKALYDSDYIDVKGAFQRAKTWHAVTHWNERCILWSDNAQVILDGDPVLTPRTVALREMTTYENTRTAGRPLTLGPRIFFPQLVNGRTRVGELYVPQFTGRPTALDTTLDVPSYIDGIPRVFAGSASPGALLVVAENDRSALYVHGYQWAADTKVQSSWSKWTMPAGSSVLAMDALSGRVGLIVNRADGLYLEVLNLGDVDGTGVPTHLDRQIASSATGVVAAVAGSETKWTLPFAQASGLVVYNPATDALIPTTQLSPTEVQTTGSAGDLTALPVVIGVQYEYRYELSRLFQRQEAAAGREVVDTNGRLRLGYLTLYGSGVYTVTVTAEGRTPIAYANTNGDSPYRVPIQTRNDEATIVITDNGPNTTKLTSIEWEGKRSARNRRV